MAGLMFKNLAASSVLRFGDGVGVGGGVSVVLLLPLVVMLVVRACFGMVESP